jgi:hypothetical protein
MGRHPSPSVLPPMGSPLSSSTSATKAPATAPP